MKIKIERPDAEAATDIFSKYVLKDLPLHPDDLAEHGSSPEACVEAMIQRVVERMYSETEENRFLEVTYANGDKEVLYFRDFNSGAMIQNIVDRAKKMAIKEFLETGQKGLRVAHLLSACVDEFSENEDLPNTRSRRPPCPAPRPPNCTRTTPTIRAPPTAATRTTSWADHQQPRRDARRRQRATTSPAGR